MEFQSIQIPGTFLWPLSYNFDIAFSPLDSAKLSCSSEVTLFQGEDTMRNRVFFNLCYYQMNYFNYVYNAVAMQLFFIALGHTIQFISGVNILSKNISIIDLGCLKNSINSSYTLLFFGCEKFLVFMKIEKITVKFQILLYLFFNLYLGTKNMQCKNFP